MVRHAPIHRRSGHSDIAICCGRNVRGSSLSTSVVPLSNQVHHFESQTIQRIQMFSDGHSEFALVFSFAWVVLFQICWTAIILLNPLQQLPTRLSFFVLSR